MNAVIALPLRISKQDVGSVVDANDVEVFVVDVNRVKSDPAVVRIAKLIVDCVNRAGGHG